MATNGFIPVNEPDLTGNEKKYLVECVESGWVSSEGPFVTRFEEEFAARAGRKHGIGVCNGTAALMAAIRALDLAPGDEVILPAFTIVSCAAAIVAAGLRPVLVDCDPRTWNVDADKIEDRVGPRTRAIMVVHIYGLPSDMPRIVEIAGRRGLAIVEDAAEAHGQTCHGKPCGSFGALSTFSFYANKLVTTGEGGMVLTDDDQIAKRCRSLRNLCHHPTQRFFHEELGDNFRLTNVQAALGVAQLERLDEFVVRKRRMGALYTKLLAGVGDLELPLAETPAAENVYWVYGIVLSDRVPFDAAEMIERLRRHGVGARPFFWGMHEQPVFRKMGYFAGERYPVTERLSRRGFYLPSGLAVTEAQQRRVVDAVQRSLGP